VLGGGDRGAAVHLTSSPVDWYAARAAGVAAYLVLSVVVTLGITMGGKARAARWPRFAVEDVHRFGGLLVGSFIGLHVLTVAIDSFLPFSLRELVVPFTAHYRPLPMGLGIAAAELLLALAITNHYRSRLRYRFWRRAHYLNFAVWGAATLHAVIMGTDRSAPWMVALVAGCVAAVAAALAWRIGRARRLAWTPAVSWGAAAAGAGLVAAIALGPAAVHTKVWNAARFNDRLTGRILSQQGRSTAIVSMAGNGSGDQRVLVRADLLLSAASNERTSLQLEYLPSGDTCVGTVRAVRSFGFDGSCRTALGERRAIHAEWRLTGAGRLRGVVSSSPA
jgi:methionine sulfoxide reductase heme-binding subunit